MPRCQELAVTPALLGAGPAGRNSSRASSRRVDWLCLRLLPESPACLRMSLNIKKNYPLRGRYAATLRQRLRQRQSGVSGPVSRRCLVPGAPCGIGVQHQPAAPSCQLAELPLWSPPGSNYYPSADALSPSFRSESFFYAPRFSFNASRAPPRLQLQASQGVRPPATSWPAVGLQEAIRPLAAMTICYRWRRRRPCTVAASGRR